MNGNERSRYKGIIFDMDNTLLCSKIDFGRMKREAFETALEAGIVTADFPLNDHTIATLLEWVRRSGRSTPELEHTLWEGVTRLEREGMQGAELEPGAAELLRRLQGRFRLVVLTNNAHQAAVEALTTNGIIGRFDHVFGREQAGEMKPSPEGVRRILRLYPDSAPTEWLAVGDSWIDGMAARQAGIPFVAYRADTEKLEKQGVRPIAFIESLSQLNELLAREDA